MVLTWCLQCQASPNHDLSASEHLRNAILLVEAQFGVEIEAHPVSIQLTLHLHKRPPHATLSIAIYVSSSRAVFPPPRVGLSPEHAMRGPCIPTVFLHARTHEVSPLCCDVSTKTIISPCVQCRHPYSRRSHRYSKNEGSCWKPNRVEQKRKRKENA